MNGFRIIREWCRFRLFRVLLFAVFLGSIGTTPAQSQGQAPDWMFALEGSYVGRMEVQNAEKAAGIESFDVRLDGLRNGREDGFVLQIAVVRGGEVEEHVEMWNWDAELDQILMTSLAGNQRISTAWFHSTNGLQTVLTRGGEYESEAAIMRLRLERLAGQLRIDCHANGGEGEWLLVYRYVLDDFKAED